MEQVLDFFQKLIDTANWPPRWQQANWSQFHGWLYVISDLLIATAFFAIPITILKYVSRRTNASFVRIYLLFAAFILACGSTHLLDAVTFWYPAYRLTTLVSFVTGVISWITVYHLVKILPVATSLRSHAELEREILERKRVEENLHISNQQLKAAQEIARLGHWQWDVASDKIIWSDGLYSIYDMPGRGNISYETYLQKIHPDDRDFVNNAIQKAFTDKWFAPFIHRIVDNDGSEKIIQSRGEVICNEKGEVIRMIGTAQDITETQKAQQQLVDRTHALETSNAELQRFAYVASHDLQEPLRKIMTFASLLDKEIDKKGSEQGKLYMEKIVKSSSRMQLLIEDILSFSSLRMNNETFVQTDLNKILHQVVSDMEVGIAASEATVHIEKLPVIEAIPSQMGQLFQNLISNAIKFRKETVTPVVTVSCRLLKSDEVNENYLKEANLLSVDGYAYNKENEQFVQIEVQDNGIGFEEEYADKIFDIFQRLHSHKMYEGTGIGLAICKRIVDNHHGLITAAGKKNEGAVFRILLPMAQKNFFTAEAGSNG